VLAQKCWKMIPAPLLYQMMGMWLRSILLEGPVAPEKMISVFESHWQYFLDVSSMVDCSILEYHQECYSFGTDSQPDHHFRGRLSFRSNSASPIHCGTTWCPHTIILRVVDTVDIEHLFIRKANPHCLLFSKICSNPICDFFPLSLLRIR
jgi:hypothetical protein